METAARAAGNPFAPRGNEMIEACSNKRHAGDIQKRPDQHAEGKMLCDFAERKKSGERFVTALAGNHHLHLFKALLLIEAGIIARDLFPIIDVAENKLAAPIKKINRSHAANAERALAVEQHGEFREPTRRRKFAPNPSADFFKTDRMNPDAANRQPR